MPLSDRSMSDTAGVQHMTDLTVLRETSRPKNRPHFNFGPWLTVGPPLFYLVVFFVVPQFYFLLYSFWTEENYSIVQVFTLDNYIQVLQNQLFREVLLRSVWVGLTSAVLCVLVSYPVAYALAFRFRRAKGLAGCGKTCH